MQKNIIYIILLLLTLSTVTAQLYIPIDEGYNGVKLGYYRGNDYGYLSQNNTWIGNQIFDGNVTINNATIINYEILNVTGNVTATDFCYLNGACISDQVSYLNSTISELNDSIIEVNNSVNNLNQTLQNDYYRNDANINATDYNITTDIYKMGNNESFGMWSNSTDFVIGYIEGLN